MHKVLYVDPAINDFGDGLWHLQKDTLKDFGIDCIYTTKYDSAFILLDRHSFDAVLCDPVSRERGKRSRLTISDGMNFIKRLQETREEIPIVVLTAIRDSVKEGLEANNIDVAGIVEKGFDCDTEILQTLNEILSLNIATSKLLGHFSEYNVRIFLSYAKEDFAEAYAIFEILRQNRYRPWMDKEDLIPGQDWELEVEKAISESNFFLACMSRNSVSKAGYVQKELKKGLDILDKQPEGSIYLIPIRIDECNVPKRFEKLHWCNFFERNGVEQLLKAVKVGCDQRGLISYDT